MQRIQILLGRLMFLTILLGGLSCMRSGFFGFGNRSCLFSGRGDEYGDASEWTPIPGEERNDFARIAKFIATHDGNITLVEGTQIHWFDTFYFRCYSNDTYVIVSYPPPFRSEQSALYWFCGKVVQGHERGFAFAINGDPPTSEDRANHFFDDRFPCLKFNAILYRSDGIFGVNFGERREVTANRYWNDEVFVARKHINPDSDARLRGINTLYVNKFYMETEPFKAGGYNCNIIYNEKGYAVWMKIEGYNRKYSMVPLTWDSSPPPILRSGSFTVNATLVKTGRNRVCW